MGENVRLKYAETPIVSLVQHNQIALFASPIVVDFVNGPNRRCASNFSTAGPVDGTTSRISVADWVSESAADMLYDNLIFKIEQLDNMVPANRLFGCSAEWKATYAMHSKTRENKDSDAKSTNCFY